MKAEFSHLLAEAARSFGIDLDYWDIWGHQHATTPEALQAILNALGLDASSEQRLAATLAERRQSVWTRMTPPVIVTEALHAEVAIRIPEDAVADGRLNLHLTAEDGAVRLLQPEPPYASIDLEQLPQGRYIELRVPLPGDLPWGYYDAKFEWRAPGLANAIEAHSRLALTPSRAWQPERLSSGGRLAGVAVSLYGVRTARNWGVGDFTDLKAVARWAAEDLGCAFVALNPLHAIANRQPYNISPYLPATAFYRNFLYLDVEAIREFALCPAARALRASPSTEAEIERLRQAPEVEYEPVARLKLRFLKLLYRQARRVPQPDFRAWCRQEGGMLDRWAVYCALDEVLHKQNRDVWIWPDWPAEYRDPDSPAVAAFAESHARLVDFYRWVQFQIHRQLQAAQEFALALGMPVGLYHDLALATDRCGGDLWAYRPFFVSGCRVGSPPDDFAPEGQDWSFPPPLTEMHRQDGYRLFIETIRKNSRAGGALRIDHVMRFFRLFWIPDGMTAKEGTYVNEPWEELLRLLALESHRGRFLVVGEDLGTVPPLLRSGLERFGVFSYRLFYFERDEHGRPTAPDRYPHQALVSSTTHDLPTLAGYWAGRDIEVRRAAGQLSDDGLYERQQRERVADKARLLAALRSAGFLDAGFPEEACHWTELTGEVHNAVIGYLVSTRSALMVLNQEDLTKETEQQNLPGTTWQYPNWRRKMRFSVEELRQSSQARDFARMFHHWLVEAGRAWRP